MDPHLLPSGSSPASPAPHILLLLVFIHGFKGSAESTFSDFPNRLAHIVRETHPASLAGVTARVYPTYDTRGQLSVAVERFVGWLGQEVALLEAGGGRGSEGEGEGGGGEEQRRGSAKGSVKVVLCGHSMGGLVAVDAALRIAQTRGGPVPTEGQRQVQADDSDMDTNADADADLAPFEEMWPHVVSVIAYDSPFYGVHPNVFRNQATKYISYAQHARDLGAHFAPLGAGIAAAWGLGRGGSGGSGGGGGGGGGEQRGSSSSSSSSSRAASAAPAPASGGWHRLAGLLAKSGNRNPPNTAPSPAPAQAQAQQGRSSSAPAVPTTAKSTSSSSSGWNTALWTTGVLATAATATGIAAYYNREQINGAYSYLTDHFEYVSNLWDDKALRERLDELISLPSVLFHAYYNHLPASPAAPRPRTFIVLPPRGSRASPHFTPLDDGASPDEVSAHMGMFEGSSAVYHALGRRSAEVLGEVVRSLELELEEEGVGVGVGVGVGAHATGGKTRRRRVDMREGQRRMETPAPAPASASEPGGTAGDEDQGLRSGDAGLEEQEEELARRFRRQREEAEAMASMASQHPAD